MSLYDQDQDGCSHDGERRAWIELHKYPNGNWAALGFVVGGEISPEVVMSCDDPQTAASEAGYFVGQLALENDSFIEDYGD